MTFCRRDVKKINASDPTERKVETSVPTEKKYENVVDEVIALGAIVDC